MDRDGLLVRDAEIAHHLRYEVLVDRNGEGEVHLIRQRLSQLGVVVLAT